MMFKLTERIANIFRDVTRVLASVRHAAKCLRRPFLRQRNWEVVNGISPLHSLEVHQLMLHLIPSALTDLTDTTVLVLHCGCRSAFDLGVCLMPILFVVVHRSKKSGLWLDMLHFTIYILLIFHFNLFFVSLLIDKNSLCFSVEKSSYHSLTDSALQRRNCAQMPCYPLMHTSIDMLAEPHLCHAHGHLLSCMHGFDLEKKTNMFCNKKMKRAVALSNFASLQSAAAVDDRQPATCL